MDYNAKWTTVSPLEDNDTGDNRFFPHFKTTGEVIKYDCPNMPVFCFSRQMLKKQVALFKKHFPGKVTFATKANPTPITLTYLQKFGVSTFDVASPWEISLLHKLFGDNVAFNYNNPIKSRDELLAAYYDYGVRSFALDDHTEFTKIAETIPIKDIQLTARFKCHHGYALHDLNSKFGASYQEAVKLLRTIATSGAEPGLSFHTGTQCQDPSAYVLSIKEAKRIAVEAGVTPVSLNVGGGFPAYYSGVDIPPLTEFFAAISKTFDANFSRNETELVCEPGRAMVATCTSVLLRIKHKRENGAIFLNDGIYGSLMELALMPLNLPVRAWRNDKVLTGNNRQFMIFGPTCDSYDVLPNPVTLPEATAEGDWLEFALVGAYGPASLTRFNGYGAFEWVEVDSIAQ